VPSIFWVLGGELNTGDDVFAHVTSWACAAIGKPDGFTWTSDLMVVSLNGATA